MTPLSDWVFGAVGGAMLGTASLLLLALTGHIAGVSGILGNLIERGGPGRSWRSAFALGLVAGPLLVVALSGSAVPVRIEASMPLLIAGGLLVGFGTRLSNGCTSGHGICGLAQFSPRSLVAVAVFFGVALATVFFVRHVMGG